MNHISPERGHWVCVLFERRYQAKSRSSEINLANFASSHWAGYKSALPLRRGPPSSCLESVFRKKRLTKMPDKIAVSKKGMQKTKQLQPILAVFKEQLESECEALALEQELAQRGHKLIWWYFTKLEGFSPSEVEDVFCDSARDLGIDALWIDDDQVVHFYQFKHPEDPVRGFPTGDVDKVISGLGLIIQREYEGVAHQDVSNKLDQIFDAIPTAYRLHLVTSGGDVDVEAVAKLNAFVRGMGMTPDFFAWECEHLSVLQNRIYQKSLPNIGSPITFRLSDPPYAVQSGDAVAYFFHATGEVLADLFGEFGEPLLQRNIRVDQRDSPTNRAIFGGCSSASSANFIHFNNGVSFLCDEAVWDNIQKTLRLLNPQIVNGGQTIRTLFKAKQDGVLKQDTLVPVRSISSSGNKTFANDVTVNQNNQNQMKTGFLRSNDVQIIQLANAMAAKGWYLERRRDELRFLGLDEKKAIELRIKNRLDGHVVPLVKGSQAYVATYLADPELAKKNVAKIFKGQINNGQFEEIFDDQLTAEKMIVAYQILAYVESFVRDFERLKRRRNRSEKGDLQWQTDYKSLLGAEMVTRYLKDLDQAIPQSAMMLAALLFRTWTKSRKDPTKLPEELSARGMELVRKELVRAFKYVNDHPSSMDKSWPNMVKSNSFYKALNGERDEGGQGISQAPRKPRKQSRT